MSRRERLSLVDAPPRRNLVTEWPNMRSRLTPAFHYRGLRGEPMRTIAIIARKGGSGKTTVAVHMAIAAHLRGRRTLLADSDPQRSSSIVLKARRDAGPD